MTICKIKHRWFYITMFHTISRSSHIHHYEAPHHTTSLDNQPTTNHRSSWSILTLDHCQSPIICIKSVTNSEFTQYACTTASRMLKKVKFDSDHPNWISISQSILWSTSTIDLNSKFHLYFQQILSVFDVMKLITNLTFHMSCDSKSIWYFVFDLCIWPNTIRQLRKKKQFFFQICFFDLKKRSFRATTTSDHHHCPPLS